jgi:type II secretory pathway component GspD/PulD (secretin)
MRRLAAAAVLFASCAWSQEQTRVFHLSHVDTPDLLQSIVNALRSIVDIQRIFPLSTSRTVVLRGTSDQVALASWLMPRLDVAGPHPGAPMESRQMAGMHDSEIRILHAAHTPTPAGLQEIVNCLRMVADLNRVFPITQQQVIMFRATPDSAALGEWLISQLDQDLGNQGPAPHEHSYNDPGRTPESAARVFYLSHDVTPQSMQEVINAVRTIADVSRIAPCNQARAIAIRATPERMQQVADLIAELDPQ